MGRVVNGSLKTLHEKDVDGKIIKTYTKRKAIEEEIINHNNKNFKMAVLSKVYKDKNYKKLDYKETRKMR